VRLHSAQNGFQRLVILSACLALVQQHSGALGDADSVSQLVRRLSAILAAPDMQLQDVATELAHATCGVRCSAEDESALAAALSSALTRSSPAFKLLCNALTAALHLHLLMRPNSTDTAAQHVLSHLLSRCGAAFLKREVAELAERLAAVAAVSEAVHAAVYEKLSADLL
jgi:hypothetical protein